MTAPKYHVRYVRAKDFEGWRAWAFKPVARGTEICVFAEDANSLSHAVQLAQEHKGEPIEWRWHDDFQAGEGQ